MKRDPDLIREILFRVEASEDSLREAALIFPGRSERQVCYHVQLLIEAGLVLGRVNYADNRIHSMFISRLTWDGHEFIEAARNDNAWRKAKETMAATGGFIFELAKPLLLDLIKQQFNLPGS